MAMNVNCESLPGQSFVLQGSSIVLPPVQVAPLPSLLIIFVLVLVQVPPPHDAEQVVVSQEFHAQFIGGARNWNSIEQRVRCHCANKIFINYTIT